MKRIAILMLLMTSTLLGCNTVQAEKIKVGILTGQNNHAWFRDTPVLKQIFDDAKIFDTTILQTPDKNDKEKAAKWEAFKPDFKQYDVIVFNYNGEMFPDHLKKSFLSYVEGGGKVLSFHAGNNPFRGWSEFEQMIGLLWRNNKSGKRVFFDKDGNKQVMQVGEGPGAGHGRQHPFLVDTHTPDNPIFADLPKQWMHAKDELYHGQRGPAENMTIMMTAYSDSKTGGTGVHEPMIWTIPYGKGLVMTNVMGHWWRGKGGGESLQCAGFQTIFTRSAEWLATGKVTIPKPDDFPTKEEVSMREIKPFKELAFIYVKGMPGSDPLASCGCSKQTEPGMIPSFRQYAHTCEPVPGEAAAVAD